MEKITYQEYEAREGFRQSQFKSLARSPGHYLEAQKNPLKTEALAFGQAFHAAILEPEKFRSEFVVAPKCDKRTSAGKAEYAAFLASSEGKTVISGEDFETIIAMSEAIKANATASRLLSLSSDRETSIFWEDLETGVKCKARLDLWCPAMAAVIDLKTTEDASLNEFSRSLYKFGYCYQAAHTLNGLARNDITAENFILIAVEKSAPYGVGIYQMSQESILFGASECQRLLKLFKECQESGNWPIYPEKIQEISLPYWAIKNKENSNGY